MLFFLSHPFESHSTQAANDFLQVKNMTFGFLAI